MEGGMDGWRDSGGRDRGIEGGRVVHTCVLPYPMGFWAALNCCRTPATSEVTSIASPATAKLLLVTCGAEGVMGPAEGSLEELTDSWLPQTLPGRPGLRTGPLAAG